MADLPRWWPRRWRAVRAWARPKAPGLWFGLILLGVVLGAVNTGNNLLYLWLSVLLGLLLVSNAWGEWNLVGLEVERRLPLELFAGEPAVGALVLRNRRRAIPSVGVRIEEVGAVGGVVVVPWVEAGEEVVVPMTWTFPARGLIQAEDVRLSSSFPFGMIERLRTIAARASVLVYPSRRSGTSAPFAAGEAPGIQADGRRRGEGDEFMGLREYAPGDPLRRVHWVTMARTGVPMVVDRNAVGSPRVMVRVEPADGERWERNLATACAQVVRHFLWGHAVGLWMPDKELPTRQGEGWRRTLLAELAMARTTGPVPAVRPP